MAGVALGIATVGVHAQDPVKAYPNNYKLVLENADVAVFRVHYGPHEKIGVHDHSNYPTVYVYLSDSGQVKFTHDETPPFVMVRPPAKAGSFRVAPARPERHMVENLGDQSSEFLRVELKRLPLKDVQKPVRGPVPEPLKAGGTDEFTSSELLIRRLVCAAGKPCSEPPTKGPTLLVAISSLKASFAGGQHSMKNGDLQWVDAPGTLAIETASAASAAPAHLLEIELIGPRK
jgi:hypothetical protein